MNSPKWFDRKFDFNLSPDKYPTLHHRLQEAPDTLAKLVLGQPDNILSHQPAGKWSVKEHTGHLYLLETLWSTRIRDILEKKPTLTIADLDNKATTEAGFNQYSMAELATKFAEIRKETISLLDSIHVPEQTQTSMHPRLQQPMRIIDIVYFTVEHDDHHIAAIRELINPLSMSDHS